MKKPIKKAAIAVLCLTPLCFTATGECSIQSEQKEILNQMESNERAFGRQNTSEFNSIKRNMAQDTNARQKDIENRKKSMVNGYAAASAEYSKGGKASPSIAPPTAKELGQNPKSTPYTLPEQPDEGKRVRRGVIETGENENVINSPDVAYMDDGDILENKSPSVMKKDKIKKLGIISFVIFFIMAGLVYIGKRQKK